MNAFAASLERTLDSAHELVGYKLAPYAYFDPFSEMPLFVSVLKIEAGFSLLQIFPIDQERLAVLSYFPNPPPPTPGSVKVPFSPMVASCLTTTIFFTFYLLIVGAAAARSKLIAIFSRIVPYVDAEKAVFTSLIATICVIIMAMYGSFGLVAVIWEALLG